MFLEVLQIRSLEPTKWTDKNPRQDKRGHGVAEIRNTLALADGRDQMFVGDMSALENSKTVRALVSNGTNTGKAAIVVSGAHVQLHFLSI